MLSMKRILFLFFLILTIQLKAQDLDFGVKAGLNLSTIVGDFTTGINPRVSGHIGVFLNYEFSGESFSIVKVTLLSIVYSIVKI